MNPASEQYHQRAAAFIRANPDLHIVVRGDAKGEEHRRQNETKVKWFTYFQVRGQFGTISTFNSILRGSGAVQFPCECPTIFDPSYEPPAQMWREEEDEKPPRPTSHA